MAYKILILGDYGVGKTSLFEFFKNNAPGAVVKPALKLKMIELTRKVEGKDVTVNICDIPAKELSSANKPKLYHKTVGAFILFEISRPDTFRHVLFWLEEVMNYNGYGKVPIMLLGNKTDLRQSSERVLNPIDAQQMIFRLNRTSTSDNIENKFQEVSTKEGKGLLVSLDMLIKSILNHNVEKRK